MRALPDKITSPEEAMMASIYEGRMTHIRRNYTTIVHDENGNQTGEFKTTDYADMLGFENVVTDSVNYLQANGKTIKEIIEEPESFRLIIVCGDT